MKALSTSIVIVVTVLTVLVVALVVLTIFSGGISQVNTISNFRNNCITQCQITCKMGALPPTWDAEVNVQGEKTSCAAKTGVTNKKCEGVCGESSGSTEVAHTPTQTECQSQGKQLCCVGAECACASKC